MTKSHGSCPLLLVWVLAALATACERAPERADVPSPVCTMTPAEWASQCSGDRTEATRTGCDDLGAAADDDAREEAALRLNVLRNHETFEALHFTHGERIAWSVGYVLDEIYLDPDARGAAIRDANRAFLGCQDRGVLAPWLAASVCGAPDSTAHGTADLPCATLDSDCALGSFDERAGCCTLALRPAGMPCEGVRVCDGSGRCVAPEALPESERVLGASAWVDLIGRTLEQTLTAWENGDGTVTVWNGADEPLATVPVGAVGVRLTIAVSPENRAPFVGVTSDRLDDTSVVTLFLPAPGDSTDVCVTTREMHELPAAWTNCEGAVAVTCVAETADGARAATPSPICTQAAEGWLRVTGPGLRAAWGREESNRASRSADPDGGRDADATTIHLDAMSGVLGRGRGGPGGVLAVPRRGPECSPDDTQSCEIENPMCGTCAGEQTCLASSEWGPCVALEVCNDEDDDCDCEIDEGGTAVTGCDDGLACTKDTCGPGAECQHDNGPGLSGVAPFSCILPGAPECDVGYCPEPLDTFPPFPAATGDSWGTGPNGCWHYQIDSWCADDWDACACNGREVCRPQAPGADPVSGCLEPPVCNPATGAHAACDLDGNCCDQDAICCEPDTDCRFLRNLSPNDAGTLVAACLLAASQDGFTDVIDGETVACWDHRPDAPLDLRCRPDGNPCTIEKCVDTTTGVCATEYVDEDVSRAPMWDGDCDDLVNQGCGRKACDGDGACDDVVPIVALGGTTAECSGDPTYMGLPTCYTEFCDANGECALIEGQDEICNSAYCDFETRCRYTTSLDGIALAEAGAGPQGCEYASDGCVIGAACIAEGMLDRPNGCRSCQGYVERFGWTSLSNNTPCITQLDSLPGLCLNGVCE